MELNEKGKKLVLKNEGMIRRLIKNMAVKGKDPETVEAEALAELDRVVAEAEAEEEEE